MPTTIDLRSELAALLNRHSAENGSDTPDFILAEYLGGCLDVYDATLRHREAWYGRALGRETCSRELPGPDPDTRERCQNTATEGGLCAGHYRGAMAYREEDEAGS